MATHRKKKEALRAALFAYFAGAHYVTEEVEKSFSLRPGQNADEITEARHTMLLADYERMLHAPEGLQMLVEMLNEEDLFPFGETWPTEAFLALAEKVIPPMLVFSSNDGAGSDYRFRFKVGFKDMLYACAEEFEATKKVPTTNDHWLTLLLNTAFYAGITAASRIAENSKSYFAVLPEIEGEVEPWGKYPQILSTFDKQLKREAKRKTGYYSESDT